MTVLDCITQVDNAKPNTYSMREKIRWLNEIEGRVVTELVDTHEGGCGHFSGYSEDDDQAELIATYPHDSIYPEYLKAKIDLESGDLRRYANDLSMFNDLYTEFANWYNRTHRPIQHRIIFF